MGSRIPSTEELRQDPVAAAIVWDAAATGRPFDPAVELPGLHPIELEIGVGKGRFLLASAAARPEAGFVGIEYAAWYHRLVVHRAARRGLGNLRLLAGDARELVERHLVDRAVDVVHVYFPDPWPKRRQRKRRLLSPPFVRVLARKLRGPGAEVRFVTDHLDYFEDASLAFATEPRFVAVEPETELEDGGITSYEIKYRREGRPIHRGRWRLAAAPTPEAAPPWSAALSERGPA